MVICSSSSSSILLRSRWGVNPQVTHTVKMVVSVVSRHYRELLALQTSSFLHEIQPTTAGFLARRSERRRAHARTTEVYFRPLDPIPRITTSLSLLRMRTSLPELTYPSLEDVSISECRVPSEEQSGSGSCKHVYPIVEFHKRSNPNAELINISNCRMNRSNPRHYLDYGSRQ